MSDKEKKPSLFKGFFKGFSLNLPLLIGGVVLLIVGLAADVRLCRLLSYSLFLAYALSASVQAVYGVSSNGYLRSKEDEEEHKTDQSEKKRRSD